MPPIERLAALAGRLGTGSAVTWPCELIVAGTVTGERAPPKPPNEHWTAPRLAGRPATCATMPPAGMSVVAGDFGPKSWLSDGVDGACGAGGAIGSGDGVERGRCRMALAGGVLTTVAGPIRGVVDAGCEEMRAIDEEGLGAVERMPAALDGRPAVVAGPDRGRPRWAVGCVWFTIRLIFWSVLKACGTGLMVEKGEAERLLFMKGVVSARAVEEPVAPSTLMLPSEEPGRPPKGGVVKEMRRVRPESEVLARAGRSSPPGLAFFGVGTTMCVPLS